MASSLASPSTYLGHGLPRRESLHVDDMAAACVHVMTLDPAVYRAHTRPLLSHLNVGAGTDVTIRELAETSMAVYVKKWAKFPNKAIFAAG
jgi:GDP-L-fucose synthase